ncbi:MAG: hydrogenase maturation protease [Saprospiraceae bacterium]|nr:hydrogenase maturation protease [Saprospiraceae bacterium]
MPTTSLTHDLNHNHTLLVGIGNNGRGDDGLGWSLIDKLEKSGLYRGDTIFRYQLQVEDAEVISHYKTVIFVDACRTLLEDGFDVQICKPALSFAFSTHEIPPESILHLCQDLYRKSPQALLLLIEGKDWSLNMGLSKEGSANFDKAWNYLNTEFL